VRLVRVRCDVLRAPLGPLTEARRKIETLLGSDTPLLDQARDRMVQGLRRRLLGEIPALEAEGAVVEVLNRLARSTDRPAALLFEAVEVADEATLALLRRILSRPGWLRLPLVLSFRSAEPRGAALALLEMLRSAGGDGSVIRAEGTPAAPAPQPEAPFPWRTLPHEVLRVLRAGAVVGPGFEAELVAELLDTTVLDVLDVIQRATDIGVPVEDLGEGRFHLPDALLDALRASLLPSVMIAWHARLGEILGGFEEDDEPPASGRRDMVEMELDLPPARPSRGSLIDDPSRTQVIERAHGDADDVAPQTPRPAAWPYADLFPEAPDRAARAMDLFDYPSEPPEPVVGPPEPEEESTVVEPARTRSVEGLRRPPAPSNRGDEGRAAAHLAAAGDLDGAAERYHAAVLQAATAGAHAQAFTCAEKALAILDALPASPRRRRLRARVHLEVGRLKWQVTGRSGEPGTLAYEPAFTLTSALASLEAGRAALDDGDPPALRAEIAGVVAGVCYDLGDPASLERALDELTVASRLLVECGDATGAARLLNDQAAVYVRLGDPVQATHLLTESRKLFEERAGADPVAAVEMAETDHLLARIPLHVAARPGREVDALTMGLDHALAAERVYRKLDATRELARVWETMGRLELRKGRLDRARERLAAAVEAEETLGDLVGLARSTAALSELLAQSGRLEDALTVLSDSITLNFEKGSPIGLAFNRRALDALTRVVGDSPTLGEARARLEVAENVLGRMKLPGEGD
jgi:tetratricopeptide (TPR) repeat protein